MFSTINEKVPLAADFGTAYASLATVGYTLFNGDGSTFQARTTTGVTELVAGTGKYRAELAANVFTAAFDGYVVWDTGGTTPVYAIEDIFVSDLIALIKAKTDLLATSTVTVVGPVLSTGTISLVVGDSYKAVDGRAIAISSGGWPDLTGATITFTIKSKTGAVTTPYAGSVVTPNGANAKVQIELTSAQTSAIADGLWTYAFSAALANGDVVTLAGGTLKVSLSPS
jgi:hypothetical protein